MRTRVVDEEDGLLKAHKEVADLVNQCEHWKREADSLRSRLEMSETERNRLSSRVATLEAARWRK